MCWQNSWSRQSERDVFCRGASPIGCLLPLILSWHCAPFYHTLCARLRPWWAVLDVCARVNDGILCENLHRFIETQHLQPCGADRSWLCAAHHLPAHTAEPYAGIYRTSTNRTQSTAKESCKQRVSAAHLVVSHKEAAVNGGTVHYAYNCAKPRVLPSS